MKNKKQILESLLTRGFDNSEISGQSIKVRCSQCEALVINGTATHETGCPRNLHECSGCNELIPIRQRYCVDCQ
jgi:hypothetical protein